MNADISKTLAEADEIAAAIITCSEKRYGTMRDRPSAHVQAMATVFVDIVRERQQHQQLEMTERSVFIADEMLRVMQNRR